MARRARYGRGVPDHAHDAIDPRSLRVSDAEREHVVELLQRATGTGLIDLDEFTRRVDAALAARTRGELNVLLIDLPGLTHPEAARPPLLSTRPARRVAPVPVRDTGGAEVRSTLSSVARRGAWDVPERLVVRTTMGSAELDFTEATMPHDRVVIDLDVVAASVELRLPAGSQVEHDQVQIMLGSIEDHRRGGAGVPAGPTFVLSGAVRAGSVEIHPPRRAHWWDRRG